jgi:protein ImuB
MPLGEAVARFESPDDLVLSALDPTADLKWLARVAAWCQRYSPSVGWKTVSALPASAAPPDALWLDIQGIGPLFGGEDRLAEDLARELTERGLFPRIGSAGTIGSAWAMTFGTEPVAIVPPGKQREALGPLPISALRLTEEPLARLEQLGIGTIGQACELPRQGLRARFGEELLVRLDQVLGAAEEVIEPHQPPPEFEAHWVLEHPTQRREEIEFILGELSGQLAEQLRQRQRGALQLAVRLDVAGAGPVLCNVGLYRPAASRRHLLDLVTLQIQRLSLAEAVGRISLAATLTSPLQASQRLLFADEPRQASALALLVDRLSSRLGPQRVLQLRLRRDAVPERAVELVPYVTNTARKPAPAAPQGGSLSYRPLVLLSPPVEVAATAIMPDGPPLRFQYERAMHVVARHWGPERIEAGWWRAGGVRRDYYRVETTSGARYWLFRELKQGHWFLHGVFA